jgi:hypothetical protein
LLFVGVGLDHKLPSDRPTEKVMRTVRTTVIILLFLLHPSRLVKEKRELRFAMRSVFIDDDDDDDDSFVAVSIIISHDAFSRLLLLIY